MITLLFTLALIIGAAATYWFMLRPFLKQRQEFSQFYSQLDATEASWWLRLRMRLKGLKTILLARLLMIGGLLLPFLSILGEVDLTAILPAVDIGKLTITPTQYVPLVITPLLGWAIQLLRQATTTEVGEPLPAEIAQEVKTVNLPESVSTPAPAPLPSSDVASAVVETIKEKTGEQG